MTPRHTAIAVGVMALWGFNFAAIKIGVRFAVPTLGGHPTWPIAPGGTPTALGVAVIVVRRALPGAGPVA